MAPRTILVIDGDLATRGYLSAALEKEGYHVLPVGSGKEGLIAAWRDHPDLIIMDPVAPDLTGEELAYRLRADQRTAGLPLVALSSDPKPDRRASCKQAGFNEYLIKTAQVMPALMEIIASLLGAGPATVKDGGLLIVFLSAKGGTGTSSLCGNLAMNIGASQPEAAVAVMDLVLPIGSIAGIVGYDGSQNLVTMTHLPASETTPQFLRDNLAVLESWRFHLLAGSPDPEQGNELNVARLGELVTSLKSAYGFVVLDLGRSLSRISLPLIEHADLIVMIVGSDVSTVTLTKTVWDYLQSKGVQAQAVYTILNRAVGLEGLTKAEAEKIIGLPIQTSVPYLGGNFSLANNQHQPYLLKFPRDTASIIFKDAAHQMIELVKNLRAG